MLVRLFNNLVLGAFVISLVACSSSSKVEKPKPVAREFKKTYVVIDASSKFYPAWVEDTKEFDAADERKKNRYFLAEGNHKSKRLCLRSAEARSTVKVASEIAQFIKNTYAEATQGGDEEEVSSYIQDNLAQETQSFVVGAQVIKTYWENRRYKQDMGAEMDKVENTCFALVKMSKVHLAKAINHSRAKLLKSISNPEVKKKTEAILKDVSDKFNQVK